MASVFIDANILLGFWSFRDGRIPSDLLLPLVEYREHILVTRQVVDEVNRRKLSVYLANKGKMSLDLPPLVPDHMIKVKKHADVNSMINEIYASAKEVRSAWESLCSDLAEAISTGQDLATQMLAPLFKQAASPTIEQLEAARDRRERGNPPGKRSDTLGDQISWKQFLDAAAGEEAVWIVTRDSDFFEVVDSRKLLNPLLYADLIAVGVKHVELHEGLASAIKSMRKAGLGIGQNIPDEKLAELGNEEERAFFPHPPHPIWPDGAWHCPNCHAVNTDTPLVPHPSQYGGWSYWTRCTRCGLQLDTGEPYDE